MSATRSGAVLVVAMMLASAAAVLWARSERAPAEELPPAFTGRVNPRRGDVAAIAAGATLFESNCAPCHGEQADGHGVAAAGLVPPPANFRGTDVLARHSDAYLFYRITDGKPGTAMPSFRGVLGEPDRWAVIAYLRSLAHDGDPRS